MSDCGALLTLCVRVLSSFNQELSGSDQHLEWFLHCCPMESDVQKTFISEVFTGCVSYHHLIKVVVRGYYAQETCLLSDTHLYTIIAYLVMFRLDELGVAQFKRLANTQHTEKVHKFLSFLFAEHNLKGWIKDEWCRIYDQRFVETTLMEPLVRSTPAMLDYIALLSDRLANRAEPRRTGKPATETRPFNLTRPSVRSQPTPQLVPTLQPRKPVPKSTYSRPPEETKLAKAFQANKVKAEEVLQESEQLKFSCADSGFSDKTREKMEQIISEREAKLQHSPVKAGPVPPSMKQSRPVKLNTVAILREGARLQKAEELEERRLAGLEAGERDDSDYLKWQDEIKQREAAEQLADIKRKHLEGQLSYEEAIIAKEQHARDTRDKVVHNKMESEALMKQYFAQRAEEQKEMRQLVEDTMSGHQNTRDAKQRLQTIKRKMVQQVAMERRELMARALEEEEADMRRKVELIQQIRTMESVPVVRVKFVDLTETSGQGLLAEMSVAELRERLTLMKLAESQDEERKRTEILEKKKAKEKVLSETLESISRHRTEQTRQASAKEEQQKVMFKKHQTELHEKQLSNLQDRLESRRRERESKKQVPQHTKQPSAMKDSKKDLPTPITTLLRTTSNKTAIH